MRAKILEAYVRGAVGIVFGELYLGKIGSFMSGVQNENLPVCVLDLTTFNRLLVATNWTAADPPAVKEGFDFTNALMYTRNEDNNNIPIPKTTKVGAPVLIPTN
eukprot:1196215-Prorocentrum_minimum.AAC.6